MDKVGQVPPLHIAVEHAEYGCRYMDDDGARGTFLYHIETVEKDPEEEKGNNASVSL